MLDTGEICLISVDGTDCPIEEPKPFNRKWYSHKFKGPGLRYEIGVCIRTGYIVWINGPFPCGGWPDLRIFRYLLKTLLGPSECVVADKGYKGDLRVHTSLRAKDDNHKKAMSNVRARHETVNGRIKMWNCTSTAFRHDLAKHHICFHAVTAITQLEIQEGRLLFQVPEYKDPVIV